jgi:diguanylate cyclase (GGDEF)-like protein
VARLGGDEFVILMEAVQTSAEADSAGRRIDKPRGECFDIDDLHLYIGASVGIALLPDDAGTCERALAQADGAMYQAKTKGRGRSERFRPGPLEGLTGRTRS